MFVFCLGTQANTLQEIRIGIGYAPVVSAKKSDPFPQIFIKGAELSALTPQVRILPVERTVLFLKSNKLDMQAPYIVNPNLPPKQLPFKVSEATFYQLNFVLYSNSKKDIDLERLADYKIVTDLAFKDMMGFEVGTITNIDATLKMVNAGRLDGVIYAANVVDPMLEMYKMKNIRRSFFGAFDVKALIAQNENTQQIDEMLTKMAEAFKFSPEVSILSSNHEKYEDWQPFERFRY